MNKNFIPKLQTNNYLIGSFDAYLEISKSLIKSNSNITNDEVDEILKNMPTTYRDAIVNKKGLGTMVINRFYDELFSIGVASVTSSVFEFNNPSIRLHEKVAELNGIRLESYYINGKLWNMNFYSKTNDSLEENTRKNSTKL